MLDKIISVKKVPAVYLCHRRLKQTIARQLPEVAQGFKIHLIKESKNMLHLNSR
ncbi:MAG TPA: hypothetical protein VFX43_05415 [Chitinophagaceae bacterium]|jgi:hypothetical protein|nr:hypothetical protein [Chitinophagaceae bacterium]